MNTAKVARRPAGRSASLLFALLATVLVCHPAWAQTGTSATVKTLSGGPSQNNPNSFSGSADGDTALLAQFNNPGGLALDFTGNFLYVADTGNSSIRQLNLPGNVTTTIISGLDVPVDVATDASTNLYVLVQGAGAGAGFIRVYDGFFNYRSNFNAVALSKPTALALDSSGNIYVTESGGAVKRIAAGTGAVTVLVPAGTLNNPLGIAVLDGGNVVVSDTGNYALRVVNPLLGSPTNLTLYAGLPGTPGLTDGVSNIVRFSAPRHIAKAGAGAIVVADGEGAVTQTDKVRIVDKFGNAQTLYGVNPTNWVSAFPGWLDSGDPVHPPEARQPNGVAIDGSANVFVSEDFYHILRKVTGTGLVAPGGTTPPGSGGSNTVINPPSLTITPNSGFFPLGQTIIVSSTSTNVFFTTDGSIPTTNSTPVVMSGGVGTIQFSNGTNDLTSLHVVAFSFNGTASASTNVSGLPATATTIGAVNGVQPTIVAGIGATAIVPVVLNLRPSDQIQSLQFRVEVAPAAGSPPGVSSQFQVLPVGTNDFIAVTTSANPGGGTNFTSTPYGFGTTRGLLVNFAPNGNFLVKNFAVAALLAVPIPPGAAVGNTYTISVLNPTATSDGKQAALPIGAGSTQTILVSNISYVVGDTSPGRWYDAGDFGNGGLSNADVNNAFYASLGIRVPYTFSDAFDAMDAFPEDSPGTVGGDGQIRFLDWQIILLRSLGLNTNPVFGISPTNWTRSWSAGGVRTNNGTTLNGSAQAVAKSTTLLPGSIWNRQAAIGALAAGSFQPGGTTVMPVFVKVYPGLAAPISGLQFHAVVTPNGDAPALTSPVQFTPSPLLNNPTAVTLGVNELARGWNLSTLNLAAATSNFLGWIQFPVPSTAQSGQTYTIHFDHVDGAPNLTTQYDLESFSSTVTVGGSAVSSLISDEWKIRFFGSVDNPLADPNADPDGDGVPNWVEFLTGTDPTDPNSHLSLATGGTRNNGASVALELLSAPGKIYVLETSPTVVGATWTPVLTNIGDGSLKEFIRNNAGGGPQFYRIRVQQ